MSRKEKLLEAIQAMKNDIDSMKAEIVWILETKSAENIPEKCIPNVPEEDNTSYSSGREKLLEVDKILSRMVNRVAFKDVTCLPVNDKLLIYRATGITQFIKFRMEIELMENRRVNRLVFEFEEESVEKLLGKWRKEFVRAKNFQTLVDGCAKFSELVTRINKILSWFFENDKINKFFQVEDTGLCGTLLKSTLIDEELHEPVLTLHWKIEWNSAEYIMGDIFFIEVPNASLLDEAAISFWTKFCEKTTFSDVDIKDLFISMADSLLKLQEDRK